MFLMRELLGMQLVEIGATFGGRDHSTVIHSLERAAAMIAGGAGDGAAGFEASQRAGSAPVDPHCSTWMELDVVAGDVRIVEEPLLHKRFTFAVPSEPIGCALSCAVLHIPTLATTTTR